MAGEKQLSDEDQALFRAAVADAQPLSTDRVEARGPAPAPKAHQSRRETEQARLDLASGAADPVPPETGEEVFWCRAGLQRRIQRRLRTGQMPVEGVVDLHGMRVEEARETLGGFLHHSLGRGSRCVRVIHGKGLRSPGGEPVLRQKVQKWLTRREEVLAFASCIPSDGGTGAIYVLLGRRAP